VIAANATVLQREVRPPVADPRSSRTGTKNEAPLVAVSPSAARRGGQGNHNHRDYQARANAVVQPTSALATDD